MILGVAAAIFAATANRWKKVFPGIMLVATLNSLLELERGHSTGSSSVLIPRSVAFVQLLVIAGVTLLSFTFKRRPLNIVDRVALLAFVASIYPGGDEVWHQKMPLALIVGGACVLAAWAYDRVRRRPKSVQHRTRRFNNLSLGKVRDSSQITQGPCPRARLRPLSVQGCDSGVPHPFAFFAKGWEKKG